MWIAAVARPDAPPATIHQYVWGYFPGMDGEPRPFLYRVLDTTILVLSRTKPACAALNITERIHAGHVYQFDVLASPRNGHNTRKPGHPHRFIRGNEERRAWFDRRLGGAVATFAQVYDRPDLHIRRGRTVITRPACVLRGTVRVDDRAQFLSTLLRGIGGGGVWGFGLLVMPEIMTCSR